MSTMNPSCDLQTKRNNDDDNYSSGPVDIQCLSEKKLELVTTINDLTDPLLSEIFVRLDAKSAHRCKSVSKTWLSQISTPCFVRSFIHHRIAVARRGGDLSLPFMFVPQFLPWNHTVENNGVTDHCSDEAFGPQGFCLDFLPSCEDVGGIGVLGASDDLLLCCGLVSPTVYYVCNPFTKKWVELPPSPQNKTDAFIGGFVSHPYYKVSSDDENKPITCDYIDSHYSYRVVRATFTLDTGSINLEIFTSDTANWSELDCSFEYPLPFEFSFPRNMTGSFLCNGRLHWMHTGRGRLVFAYDPFSGYSAMMPIPEEGNVHLGVYKGRLRVLNMLINEEGLDAPCVIRVWEMDEDKWRKVYDVSMDTSKICSNFLPDLSKSWSPWSQFMSIAFHPYKGDKVYMWFEHHFAWCNLRKGKFQMKEWNGFGKFHQPGRMVFSLVKPWFPTPVPALTPIQILEQ